MPIDKQNLIWIDLEMTGLQPEKDRILEIAIIITDNELNTLAEGPVLAVRQPESVLTAMNAWCQAHHKESGLLDRVRSPQALSEAQAEEQTLQFLQEWTVPGSSPMCGNSICQDRRFLYNYMPLLEAHFHYRNLDVSTLKILAQRWYPENAEFPKEEKHLALDDIRESIGELRHYRQNMLRAKD